MNEDFIDPNSNSELNNDIFAKKEIYSSNLLNTNIKQFRNNEDKIIEQKKIISQNLNNSLNKSDNIKYKINIFNNMYK